MSQVVFPGEMWQTRDPGELALDDQKLADFRDATGNHAGIVIKDGYQAYSWGDVSAELEWASAAKPVYSTLLLFALREGKISSIDQTIDGYGWALRPADEAITFRHLASMTSGYALPEDPGDAWGYNDYAIRLYLVTLIERVFNEGSPDDVATAAHRLGALNFQDERLLGPDREGFALVTAPRDFARIGWLWLNKGNWDGQQLLPASYFDTYWKPQVPAGMPRTQGGTDDYLGNGSLGGATDQSSHGPGSYGMNIWFNTGQRLWPEVPADAYQANGHWNREVMTVIPSLGIVAAWKGNMSTPEEFADRMNEVLRHLAASVAEPSRDDLVSKLSVTR